jgi:GSCFA family
VSDFPYDTIPERQTWAVVTDAVDRAAVSPQGPAKFACSRDAKIASAGSCFGQRIAERLPALGLNCMIAEPAGAPFSARWGTIYNVGHLQQLLERAHGRFVPLERAWETSEGRFVDPFRPSVEPTGFATVELLEEEQRTHLAAVRRLFAELDLFVFTLGLTEYWSDARDGAVFPMCPGRGRGVFDPSTYVHANMDVAQTCESLTAFISALRGVNAGARVVLTVSPVPIAATMEAMHVVRASLLAKSTLKVAAERIAALHDHVDYFASYDLVTANLGAEKLFAADGRHVTDAVADRVTRLFAATYFGVHPLAERAAAVRTDRSAPSLAADCDEDRLLALLGAERAAAPRPTSAEAQTVDHAIPLYFVGDSGCIVFRDAFYRSAQRGAVFIGRGLHTPSLYAGELVDAQGKLNAAVAAQLVFAGVLHEDESNGYVAESYYSRFVGYSDELRLSPPVTLFCGGFDTHRLLGELGMAMIAVPEALAHGLEVTPRAGDVPFEEAVAAASRSLEPFEAGLRLLKSYGLRHLAVHMAVPWNLEPSNWHPNAWHDLVPLTQRYQIVMNAAIARICKRAGVLHVDIWRDLVDADGWRDPRFTLDVGHVNYAASAIAVDRILDAFAPLEASVRG